MVRKGENLALENRYLMKELRETSVGGVTLPATAPEELIVVLIILSYTCTSCLFS